MCISGFTSLQRSLWESANAGRIGKVPWMLIGSGNKLVNLHQLYCGGEEMDKSLVKVFVEGTLDDVRENFQVPGQTMFKPLTNRVVVCTLSWSSCFSCSFMAQMRSARAVNKREKMRFIHNFSAD